MIRTCLNLCLSILTAGTLYGIQVIQEPSAQDSFQSTASSLCGSYSIVVDSYDWGAGVSQAILSLDAPITFVSPDYFQVTEECQFQQKTLTPPNTVKTVRTVTGAYLSDPAGAPVTTPSPYITLELAVTPDIGSPLVYQPDLCHYELADPYQLTIRLKEDCPLAAQQKIYTSLTLPTTPDTWVISALDGFEYGRYTAAQYPLSYSSYTPPSDGRKKPLVIWLHGLGEGGTDPIIPLLGCEATAFAQSEFQQLSGGAYVLAPQCPTLWLDDGKGQTTQTGESCYTESLMALIRDFLAVHPDADQSRIYVGGCSNGGYMTMELLLRNPGFFAAAFPVCQPYKDLWISDDELRSLLDTPIWFIHSELDTICPPEESTFPTVERLRAAGGKKVLLTRMTAVYGDPLPNTDQRNPQQYNPHFSWIPVLNGDIYDPDSGQNLFQWLLKQQLP